MNGIDRPFIPETVTVHLGRPEQAASNVTVSFPDYIKNVASSEIYPTWPESALRANIYAQISFALNRIYTEFYRSRGYDFDITNSTAFDQFFVPNRDVFENVSQIVDEIFNSYVVRQGSVEPLFTQYCNGTTSVCDGLSQWGTVPLANEGLTPYEILQSFYGDDIDIVTNVPVAAITASVPPRPLRLGSTGNDVQSIQVRLNRISSNYPAIPKIDPANGLYDQSTEDAVREFQRIFDLGPDGIVGEATWYKIQFVYNGVKRLSELDSEGLTIEELSRQFPRELSEGDSGGEVRVIQYLLSYVALYNPSVPAPVQDGIYGPLTAESVRAFQRLYGLPETGVMDEATYSALYDAYRGIITSLPDSQFIGRARPYPGFVITTGQSNEYVTALQEYLNVISQTYTQIPSVTVDGVFGPATENAVRAFQAFAGLPENGIVALSTWDAITSLYEDLVKGSVVTEGQFPGENSFYEQ